MNKIAIIYWSGTGNTEAMANIINESAKNEGAEVSLFTSAEFSANLMDDFEAIAFGCPSMGAEELEESEFEPMFQSCEEKLKNKKIALFGSYGWGDGEWMRNWEQTCITDGAILISESVICNELPDDEAIELCKSLGKVLAKVINIGGNS